MRSGARPRFLPVTGMVPVAVTAAVSGLVVLLLAWSPALNPWGLVNGTAFDVKVPRLTGLTQTSALVRLRNARQVGAVRFDYSSTVDRGMVMGQRPRAGSVVRRGDRVVVVVSRGNRQIAVPSVVNTPESTARRDLRSADLRVSTDHFPSEDIDRGRVIRQIPAAGVLVSGGTEVVLTISDGPRPRQVPDVAGITLEGAAFRIGQAGLRLGTVTQVDDAKVAKGAVVSVSPAAGTTLKRDTRVDVVVSAGAPPVSVPTLVGGTMTNAADTLARLGLVAGEVSAYGDVGDVNDGKILAQSPDPGTQLRPGSVVTLTVRRAAPTPPTTVAPTPGGG